MALAGCGALRLAGPPAAGPRPEPRALPGSRGGGAVPVPEAPAPGLQGPVRHRPSRRRAGRAGDLRQPGPAGQDRHPDADPGRGRSEPGGSGPVRCPGPGQDRGDDGGGRILRRPAVLQPGLRFRVLQERPGDAGQVGAATHPGGPGPHHPFLSPAGHPVGLQWHARRRAWPPPGLRAAGPGGLRNLGRSRPLSGAHPPGPASLEGRPPLPEEHRGRPAGKFLRRSGNLRSLAGRLLPPARSSRLQPPPLPGNGTGARPSWQLPGEAPSGRDLALRPFLRLARGLLSGNSGPEAACAGGTVARRLGRAGPPGRGAGEAGRNYRARPEPFLPLGSLRLHAGVEPGVESVAGHPAGMEPVRGGVLRHGDTGVLPGGQGAGLPGGPPPRQRPVSRSLQRRSPADAGTILPNRRQGGQSVPRPPPASVHSSRKPVAAYPSPPEPLAAAASRPRGGSRACRGGSPGSRTQPPPLAASRRDRGFLHHRRPGTDRGPPFAPAGEGASGLPLRGGNGWRSSSRWNIWKWTASRGPGRSPSTWSPKSNWR